MQAASGNSSDKTAFSEIVTQHAKSFQSAIDNRYLVGDSALYTPASIKALHESNSLFVTRVPGQIKATSAHIAECSSTNMVDLGNGYFGRKAL